MAKNRKEDAESSAAENTGVTDAAAVAEGTGGTTQATGEDQSAVIASLEKKLEHQAALIKDLKEELNGATKNAVTGKRMVKDSRGKNFQFIGKKHKARLKEGGPLVEITAEFLSMNPDAVDVLREQKVGFLV